MLRFYDGYAVELAKQVLVSGSWGRSDCEWRWECEYKYFISENDADKYFEKCKKLYPNEYQMVRMLFCEITYGSDRMETDIGDEIKEYVIENGDVVVWYL